MNLQRKLNKERYFITGNNKKLNISFIPALATQIYQDYMSGSIKLGPGLMDQQKAIRDPEVKAKLLQDADFLREFNEKAEELHKQAEEVNALGMEIITVVLESNDQKFKVTEREILKRMSLDDMNAFIQEVCVQEPEEKKKVKDALSVWMPNVKKFIQIFIREYGVSREEALLTYNWEDIQSFVMALPIERVITVYESKDADNKGRYLAALCDRNEMVVKEADRMADEFEERLKKAKEKERGV